MTKTSKLAAGDDLSSYTWDLFMDDVRAAGMFDSHWFDIDLAINESVKDRMVYARARRTESNIDLYTNDEKARFALNVKALRQTPYGAVTPDDILDRPRHWLVAYAIAEKLAGRAGA